MRLLWWQEGFRPGIGGVQLAAEPLLQRLRQRRHEIVVWTSQDSDTQPRELDWNGIPVRRFAFWQTLNAARIEPIVALRAALDELGAAFAPDLVHMNGFGPSALFHRQAGVFRRMPFVLALHSSNTLSAAAASLARQTLEQADWVTACSQSLLDAAIAAAPAIAARAAVIHNAVEMPARAPSPLPAEPRLLCLGELAPHKGMDLAIRALAALLPRFPTLRLVVAGAGPCRNELEQLARDQGVSGNVDIVGAVRHADVLALINAATLVVVPSRRESFSLVAVEAAVMARPVVATRVDGLPEVVGDGDTGLLVEPESSTRLADAIATLLADRPRAARLGAEGRRRAMQRFDVERQADAFEAIYRRSSSAGAGVERACS